MAAHLLLNLDQAAAELGIRRTKLFELLAAGDIKGVSIGRRRLIPRSELEAYVNRLLAAAAASPAA